MNRIKLYFKWISTFKRLKNEKNKTIIKNKNIIGFNKSEIEMLSTNFCYGGEEIYEIENLKN